jgi:UDPglucose 6-dehydrogenase
MIVMIGAGYVGLVTAACFAEMGHRVTCIDIDEQKLTLLEEGKIPFYEPQLDELVSRNRQAGRLFFSADYKVVAKAQICFLALPTPSDSSGACNLSHLLSAVAQIAELMSGPLLIVIKSTVPVGVAEQVHERVKKTLLERKVSYSFEVLSNPEFLRESTAVSDCFTPDRIIIGVQHPVVSTPGLEVLKGLYVPFCTKSDMVLIMDWRSAELAKYAANAMLASRISFMNELAGLCERLGVDVSQVADAIGKDHRIGTHYMSPGLGYGGSCLPKDLRALQLMAAGCGYSTPLLNGVETINQRQRELFLEKIVQHLGVVEEKVLAVLGLSFKPETDDLREAPSLYLIQELHERGAHLRLYDPVAMSKAEGLLKPYDRIYFCQDAYEAARGADALLLITEWNQFRLLDFEKVLELMKGRALFDGRNHYHPQQMEEKGFVYFGMGRKNYAYAARSV